MEIRTDEILALVALDTFFPGNLVTWANERLEAGDDTPSLRMLAGEQPLYQPFVVDELFRKAVDELGLKIPATTFAAEFAYAASQCRAFRDGEMSSRDALQSIYYKVIMNDGLTSASYKFFYHWHRAYCEVSPDDLGWSHADDRPEVTLETIDGMAGREILDWLTRYEDGEFADS